TRTPDVTREAQSLLVGAFAKLEVDHSRTEDVSGFRQSDVDVVGELGALTQRNLADVLQRSARLFLGVERLPERNSGDVLQTVVGMAAVRTALGTFLRAVSETVARVARIAATTGRPLGAPAAGELGMMLARAPTSGVGGPGIAGGSVSGGRIACRGFTSS